MMLPKDLFAMMAGAFLACLTLLAASASGYAESRPARSECIVGFSLDWSKVKADRHEVRNSLYIGPEGRQRIVALAATAINRDGTRLYLQFRRDCEKKQEMAAEVMRFWRSKGLDLPTFERINEPIAPSPDTIEVWGPSWRDGPQEN